MSDRPDQRPSAQVVVSVGTYHLPFERLVTWMDGWSRDHPEVGILLQHGVSSPLAGADNRAMLPHPDLLAAYAAATVVVLQGGAGGVMDAVELGIVPIVVPRVPELDEVIDQHQVVFTRELARLGVVHPAQDPDTLTRLLDAALAGELRTRSESAFLTPGSAAVAASLDRLPDRLPGRERLRRARRLVRGASRPAARRSPGPGSD